MENSKKVRLFVASSINEFRNERQELGNFLNKIITKYWNNLNLDYEICENESPRANPNGKQSEFDAMIRDCHLFFLLVGKSLGDVSRHEFDIAWECLEKNGSPQVLPFFQRLPDESKEESARQFYHYYRYEKNNYPFYFTHIDTVKLSILLELKAGGWLDMPLRASDGAFRLGEDAILSTENIPVYQCHKQLESLRIREAELKKKLQEINTSDEDSFSLERRRFTIDSELEETQASRRKLETQLFNLCATVISTSVDNPVTERLLTARQLVDTGDTEGALALLQSTRTIL